MLTSRRRGYCKKVDRIMTNKTNSPVLSICKAQNWCASSKYMTKKEAESVTDISTVFKLKTGITQFNEFEYFINIGTIPADAFRKCTNMTSIKLPPNKKIYSYAFEGCSKLNYVNIPIGTTWNGTTRAFSGCNNINIVNWDCALASNDNAELSCKEFTSTVYDVYEKCLYNGTTLFKVPKLSTINFKPGTTRLGNYCAERNSSIVNLIIPEGVTAINTYALHFLSNMVSLDLPSTLTSTGNHSISYGQKCTNLTIRAINAPTLGASTFYNWSSASESVLRTLYIPLGATGYSGGLWDTYLLNKGWTIEYITT